MVQDRSLCRPARVYKEELPRNKGREEEEKRSLHRSTRAYDEEWYKTRSLCRSAKVYKEEWYTREQKEEKKKNSVHFIGQQEHMMKSGTRPVHSVSQQECIRKSGTPRNKRKRRGRTAFTLSVKRRLTLSVSRRVLRRVVH